MPQKRPKTKRQSVTARWRETFNLPRYQALRATRFEDGVDLICNLLPHLVITRGETRLRRMKRYLICGDPNA